MKQIAVFDKNLKEVKNIDLSDNVFDIKPNEALIHQVSVSMLSNLRRPLAHTKTRSEVSGGGKKPWRQKGTGRARQGSIRSPLWVGGGITFGPRNVRNFSQKINDKMRQKAFCMLLTNKVDNNLLMVIDNLNFDKPKTKDILNIIDNSKFKGQKSVLFVVNKKDDNVYKAVRNIEGFKIKTCINVLDLLKYKNVIMDEPTITSINERYSKLNFKNK
ncbi:50S ribosomal protein L4 [Patescibacteria group bacterium]|nr:50S ribosomal protein L4 [Patescibacteria group bacterium]